MKRLASLLLVVLAACGDTGSSATTPLNLDRPVDLTFACHGGLRLVGDDSDGDGNPGEADDEVTVEPQPMEACRIRSLWAPSGEFPDPPLGQEDLTDAGGDPITLVEYFGFVLQSVPGTVALARFATAHPSSFTGIEVNLFDADELTPGRNSIAVGALPIAIGTDRAGCHVFTANAGSCDLSVIGVESVVDEDPATPPDVRALTVTNAAGDDVLARPAAMIAEPGEADQPIGVACPAEPEGLAYIAYPDCHLVAAVRVGTGQIEAGIRFNEDGTVTITDGNVSCPAQCGGGGPFVAGERPVALDLVHDARVDTRRLAIGAEDSAIVTVVELGADYLPLSFSRVTLEGDVGVIDVALTPQLGMGGDAGTIDDSGAAGGQHQFVYAVVSDGSIRVADTLGTAVECDTQVDPRYLRGETDVGRLACLAVGDVATPPRRMGAQGPGIRPNDESVPLTVAIAPVQQFDGETGTVIMPTAPSPDALVGYYAFATTSSGDTLVINVDDDDYVDLWSQADPLGTMLTHVMPHQLRDNVGSRNEDAIDDDLVLHCDFAAGAGAGAPKLDPDGDGDGSVVQIVTDRVNAAKAFVMPGLRNVSCVDDDTETPEHLAELAFAVPPEQRDLSFPDLHAVLGETWFITWEGLLSRDESDDAIDGPSTRIAVVERDGNLLAIRDGTRPFCDVGVQRFDIADLVGCDPALGDAQCGVGLTCYTHPDAVVPNGTCLPADEADTLAIACRDFLLSARRYSVSSSQAGELRIMPRRHILATTPIDGCTSDTQCQDLAIEQAKLASPDHPVDYQLPDGETLAAYTCGLDPTRGGPDRCMMTCEDDTDCDDGTQCSNGWCIEGVIPPAECLPGVQRFQLRAGDALAVVGTRSGHIHPIVEDEATGACVVDPAAHPLQVGRIPLDPPPCPAGADDYGVLSPNPCSLTIEHVDEEPAFGFDGQSCTGGDPSDPEENPLELVTRDAPAIRFKNGALTFHLVDPWYPGDLECRGDRAAGLMLPTLRTGFSMQLEIQTGFVAKRLDVPAVFPINVVRGPEDSIWVIDEGDNIPDILDSSSTRGQVFRVEPMKLSAVNVVQ
jgi:hypothetical protein